MLAHLSVGSSPRSSYTLVVAFAPAALSDVWADFMKAPHAARRERLYRRLVERQTEALGLASEASSGAFLAPGCK